MPVGVPLERSGSTAVIVLVTPSHILCANAGDSRAILSKKSTGGSQKKSGASSSDVLPLSFDHKPNKDVEVTRVEKDGGFVSTKRVDGSLAVSRGFGDFAYKNCARDLRIDPSSSSDSSMGANSTGSSAKDHRVTVHPDIIVHNREPLNDEFVVLACDGIWDRLTNKECAELVRDLAIDEGEEDAGLICEEIIDMALELDSRDNMTICAVFFPAVNGRSAPNIDSGVLKRRMDRKKSWGSDSTPAKRAQLREDERCKGKDAKGGTPSRSARLAGSRALRQKQELRRSRKVLESGKDKQRRQ